MKIILVGLAVLGYWGTWHLSTLNNSLALQQAALNGPKPYVFPATKSELKSTITGIGPIDHLARVLIVFFRPGVDGLNPSLTLLLLYFCGQITSIATGLYIDSYKVGNKGKFFLRYNLSLLSSYRRSLTAFLVQRSSLPSSN